MSITRHRSNSITAQDVAIHDEDKLAEMGYKQELNRSWSALHNFGVSFSIIVSWSLGLQLGEKMGIERGGIEVEVEDIGSRRHARREILELNLDMIY
jgi:hypothetical protein